MWDKVSHSVGLVLNLATGTTGDNLKEPDTRFV